MKLILHGTGAGEPASTRGASALTATVPGGDVLLLDAGEGVLRAMLRDQVDLNSITTVAISHMHPDHWCGLPGLVVGWAMAERSVPVNLFLPPDSIDFFHSVLQQSYIFLDRLPFPLVMHPLQPFKFAEGWTVAPFPTSHLARFENHVKELGLGYPAYGYMLTCYTNGGERKIVLSQDIGSEHDLLEVLPGAELLICESAHVDPGSVLRMAANAVVGRVVFTHVPPGDVPFPEHFDAIQWAVATDGYVIEV